MRKLLSLQIQNSNFFGADFTINFSEKLTCIMGGRGTGKSTILHFIKSCIEENAEDNKDTYDILENNLGSGLIKLYLADDNGDIYRIEKSFGENPQPYLDFSNKHIPLENIKWQLSADIFPSQLIEEIGRNDEARLKLIDKMLIGEIEDSFQNIEGLQIELSKNAKSLISENTRLKKVKDSLLDFTTANDELLRFQNEPHEDIKDEERIEFEKQDAAEKIRNAEHRFMAKLLNAITEYLEKTNELNDENINILLLNKSSENFTNKLFFSTFLLLVEDTINKIVKSNNEIQTNLHELIAKIKITQANLKNLHDQQHNVFIQLKQKLEKNKVFYDKMNSLTKRVDQKQIIEKEIEETEVRRRKLKKIREKFITEFQKERSAILEKRLKKIKELNELFNPRIKITLTPGAITNNYEELLRNALKGHNMRYNTIIPYLINNFSPDKLAKVIYSNDVEKLKHVSSIDIERSSAVMKALFESESIYTIESLYCPDLPEFHLKVENEDLSLQEKRDDYKRSDQLSTGQRCTAVLPIVFSISSNPLIIDQPEDNLDNKYISETIHKIIKNQKENRQLILITHNANIPVLSGSEHNIFLKYNEGKSSIQKEGTVDEVKESIVNLLEGGREAFIQRKELYGY